MREIRPTEDMRTKSSKLIGSTLVLLALGSLGIIEIHAQQKAGNARSPALGTNWVGYLVAGRRDSTDPISTSPFPSIVGQVEIGLRSDGVVIWRKATNPK